MQEKILIPVRQVDGSVVRVNVSEIVTWHFTNHCLTIETIRGEHRFRGGNTADVAKWLSAGDIGTQVGAAWRGPRGAGTTSGRSPCVLARARAAGGVG